MPLKKILFVDDDTRILAAMRRRLSEDFNVVTFDRGHAAVEYIQKHEDISVLIADMRMPEMDGLELLQHSEKIRPNLKRIMLTGNSDQKTAVDAINDGKVFRFLRKPCDSADVKKAVNLAIEESDFTRAKMEDITNGVSTRNDASENQGHMFLSVMSDELRTPLSQVISISDTLGNQELILNERAKSRMLRQIGEAGQCALERVDRILTFVKLQSSSANKATHQVRLDLIAAEEIQRVRSLASERNVTISFESNLVPVLVQSFEENIRIALRETLQNAVKFNEDNGHISVQIKANLERAAMRITNSGKVMEESVSARAGQVFQPLDSSLNRLDNGIGLGLSLIGVAASSGGFNYDLWPREKGGAWMTFVFDCAAEV